MVAGLRSNRRSGCMRADDFIDPLTIVHYNGKNTTSNGHWGAASGLPRAGYPLTIMFDGIDFSPLMSSTLGTADDARLRDLLSRCAGRDRAALRALYDLTAPKLLGIALRLLRNRPQAEDVVQEAFLQIWRNAGRFDTARGSAMGWMVAILRYRALDRIESEKRHTGTDELPDVAAELPVSVEDQSALAACLATLPEPWQRSINLAFVDGYSHSEIAELTKTPLGTIKSWILRGWASLKRCLEA